MMPRGGIGEVTVYPGLSARRPPHRDGRAFFWLDYPDDGRYLLKNHDSENFTVTPGDSETLMRRLSDNITACARWQAFSS